MKKRSIILGALALVLVAALSVGGTLAYLTAMDSKVNTFTVGNVGLSLTESTWDASKAKLIPNSDIPKNPTVTIAPGSEDCYLRVKVTIPARLQNLIGIPAAPTGWRRLALAEGSNVFVYQYDSVASAGFTATLFSQIHVNPTLNNPSFAGIEAEDITMTVKAEAIQKATFADATAAWAAFDVQHP